MALERETIAAALRRADGNMDVAARMLGCSRRTLQNRLRSYRMPRSRAGRRKRTLRMSSHASAGALAGLAVVAVGVAAVVSRFSRKTST